MRCQYKAAAKEKSNKKCLFSAWFSCLSGDETFFCMFF
jgi:hypothetical protein